MRINVDNVNNSQQSMTVKIFSPSQTFFNGLAKLVSGKNQTGDFDVLPQHHSFITLLPAGKVKVVTDSDSELVFDVEGGLMRVKDDKVTIFIGF